MKREKLKEYLDELYRRYNRKSYLDSDPLMFVHQYRCREEMEIAALIASSLSYGNIKMIKKNVATVLNAMNPSPLRFLLKFEPYKWKALFGNFRHRFNDGEDVANLIFFAKQMIEQHGSVEAFFMQGYDPLSDMKCAIDSFSRRALLLKRVASSSGMIGSRKSRKKYGGVIFFFPSPSDGSPCKRLNLFLRWMIRKDRLDLGLWKGVARSQLVIPLDIHVVAAAQKLGLTRRENPSWHMAVEITETLKMIDPEDPVKYDFALCHKDIVPNDVK
ncbi:MAG: TIGR02757 family protein [Acidobacteriota bacterium]